jgi:neutral amino acid transport system permease protein
MWIVDASDLVSSAAASLSREIPLVLSLWLQAQVSRYLDLTLGAALTLAAYVSLFMLPFVSGAAAADAAGIVTGAVLSLSIAVAATIAFRRWSSDELLLASFAVYSIVLAAVAIAAGSAARSLRPSAVSYDAVGFRVAIAALLLATLYVVLRKSGMGRELRAVADDLELARAHGIAVLRTRLTVAAIAGALASLSGIFIASDFGAEPNMAWQPLLDALVPVVLASGRGLGAVGAAAAGFAVVKEATRSVVGDEWQQGLTVVILLAVLAALASRRTAKA